jgi:hypothetical protein
MVVWSWLVACAMVSDLDTAAFGAEKKPEPPPSVSCGATETPKLIDGEWYCCSGDDKSDACTPDGYPDYGTSCAAALEGTTYDITTLQRVWEDCGDPQCDGDIVTTPFERLLVVDIFEIACLCTGNTCTWRQPASTAPPGHGKCHIEFEAECKASDTEQCDGSGSGSGSGSDDDDGVEHYDACITTVLVEGSCPDGTGDPTLPLCG